MSQDLKHILKEQRFLEKRFWHSPFILTLKKDGSILITSKPSKIDDHTVVFFLIGVALFVVNFIEEYHPIMYIFSACFLGIVPYVWITGPIREKNQYFAFNKGDQSITYNKSIRNNRRTIPTNTGTIVSCHIHTFRSNNGGRRHYSATFYAKTQSPPNKDIIFNMHSHDKSACEKLSKYLIRYLVAMSDLKEIEYIEHKSSMPGHQ